MLDDKNLYEMDYFLDNYFGDYKREQMYQQEYARICSRLKIGGNVLDVGCGIGGFLNVFEEQWIKSGVEPSDWARDKARANGIHVLPAIRAMESTSQDLVVFRGTFQHISLPMSSLSQATRILKPGGSLVFLATPDTGGLVYKLWGNLPMLDAERNWILPGSKWLTNVLSRLGYKDIEVLHPYWNTPYASPVADFGKFAFSLLFGYRKFAFPGNMMEIYATKG